MKPFLFLPALAFAILTMTSRSVAAVIVSDDFLVDGPPNYNEAVLSNQNATGGTFGYKTGSSWLNNTGIATVQATGLTHPLVVNPPSPVGDGLVYAPGVNQVRSQVRNIQPYATDGADYYLSGLMTSSTSFPNGTTMMGISSGGALAALPSNGLQIGFTGGGNINVFYKNGDGVYTSSVLLGSYTTGSTYMVVLHLGGSGTTLDASVYNQAGTLVNSLTGLATSTVVATDLTQVGFATSANFNAGVISQVKYDALRFGTTLADVMIPEPSAILLTACGAFGLLIRRRA